MRRVLIATCLFFAAVGVAVAASQLTVAEIVAAAHAGATQEGILALINNPSNTVAVPTPAEVQSLRDAGVSDTVIQAIQSKAAAAANAMAARPARVPDDPRLIELVRVVHSGLSEDLVIDQLKNSGDSYALTSPDLLYLKDNNVPESIISTLLTRRGGGNPVATGGVASVALPVQPAETTISGLTLVKPTFLRKNRTGLLILKPGEITWNDSTDTQKNFTVKANALERVWAKCRPLPSGRFCYEVGFEVFKGENYTFRDVGADTGSRENVAKLQESLKATFPKLVIEEKLDNN